MPLSKEQRAQIERARIDSIPMDKYLTTKQLRERAIQRGRLEGKTQMYKDMYSYCMDDSVRALERYKKEWNKDAAVPNLPGIKLFDAHFEYSTIKSECFTMLYPKPMQVIKGEDAEILKDLGWRVLDTAYVWDNRT